MPAVLTKTTTVLHRRVDAQSTRFRQMETMCEARQHEVEVDLAVWVDLGSPDVITVTIVPGDRLNDEVAA